MGKGISFSGSGEMDNGFTMSYSYTMTNAAFSSQNIMLDMGDGGSIGLGNGASGAGLRTVRYLLPTAGEEAWDDTDTDDNGLAQHADTNALYYNGNFAGFGVSAAYVQDTGGSDHSIALKYGGLMDGLTLVYGFGEDGETVDLQTYGVQYTMGSVSAAYQKSERDFAFIVNKEVKAQDLIDTISNVDESLIKNIKVFDVYEGDNIPENQKSIAISVTIQSSERTLNDNDLEKINNLIIKTVEDKTGAKIRS